MKTPLIATSLLLAALLVAAKGSSEHDYQIDETTGTPSNSIAENDRLVNRWTDLQERRQQKNINGYEDSPAFRAEMFQTRLRIEQTLSSPGPFPLTALNLNNAISSALDNYENNRDEFNKLYPPSLGSILKGERVSESSEQARRAASDVLTLYILVQAKDPGLADTMKKRSYIWPFCRSRH